MKLKKLMSIVLILALLAGGTALGEVSAEARAAAELMIAKFDIPDTYAEFSCDRYDDVWDLTWSDDGEYLSISCGDDGSVYSYYKDSELFPDVAGLSDAGYDEIYAVCDDFLAKCVPEGWEWAYDSARMNAVYDTERAYVEGCLVYEGLPTDVRFDMNVYLPLMEVCSFYRGGQDLINARIIPVSDNITDEESAKALLKEALALKLTYSDYTYENGAPRELYYQVKTYPDQVCVRCDTGELTRTQDAMVYEAFGGGGEGDYEDDGFSKSSRPLTEAELAAANIYEGALTPEQVVDIIKAVPSFGLTDDFAITDCDYYITWNSEPMCSVYLSREVPEDEAKARGSRYGELEDEVSATVNAVTGAICSLSIYRPYYDYQIDSEYSDDEALAALEYLAGDRYGELRLDSMDVTDTRTYTFDRVHNGIPVSGETAYVGLGGDGELVSYYISWDNGMTFIDRTEDEIAPYDDAFDTYLRDVRFEMAYVTLYDEEEEGFVFAPAYRYVDPTGCYAVDAVTLERCTGYETERPIVYDDIDDCEHADIITRLASLGVGFDDTSFDPERELSCNDALALVMALDGWDIRGRSFDNLVYLWDYNGFFDISGYEYDHVMTRGEFAKMLVAAAGYSKAAALDGIFLNPFSDEVPGDLLGALDIAWKLGFIEPDESGAINADAVMTRDEAIICAYNYLNAEK